jgi:O-antigen/teichoic acid export membrane protein
VPTSPSSRQSSGYRRFIVHLVPDVSAGEPSMGPEKQSEDGTELFRKLITGPIKDRALLTLETTTRTTQAQATGRPAKELQWDLTETDSEQDLDCEQQSTIPMMVLTSISRQQEQSTPTMQAEISGAAGNATISGIGNIGNYVIKTGSTFLMQHGLGAAAFGLYSLGFSVIMFVASIFTFGLDDAMVRYIAIYRSKRQEGLIRNLTIFCTALAGICGLLGGFAVLYFAPFLAKHLIHHAETTPLLQLMAPIIPLTSMQMIWTSGLQGFKDFKKRVMTQRIIIPVIVVLLLLITFIFFPKNLIAVIIVTLISTILSTTFSFYFLFGRIAQIRAKEGHNEIREWLCFATPNFLTNIIDIVLDAIDTLLLGYFGIPKVGIGQYSAAIKISGFIAMPLSSLNTMFSPTIAELHSQGDKQKLEAMFKVVTQWAITFSLPIFCISALFSAALLDILSGKDFVGAWPLLIVFGAGGMANAGTGSVGFMLLMTGHQKLSFINSLAAVVINIVLGILLTPRYGAMGTAISTGMAAATVNFMRLLQVRFLLKIQPYRKDTLKPLGAGLISSLATGGLLYFIHLAKWTVKLGNIHIPIELSLIPVFLAIYIWTLVLLGISPEDKMILNKLKNKMGRSGAVYKPARLSGNSTGL